MAGFRYVTLTGSVGKEGQNAPANVTSVQEIINAHPAPGLLHPTNTPLMIYMEPS